MSSETLKRDGCNLTSWPYKLLPDDAYGDEATVRLEDAYHVSNRASVDAQRTYRRILALLAGASTVVALAFLLYDAIDAFVGLVLVGLTLLLEWTLSRQATSLDCHRTYIEQRVLAEALRVQINLRYAGSALRVGDLLTWTQLEETGWVRERVNDLLGDADPGPAHDIRECWVEDQRSYHAKAAVRTAPDVIRSERVVHIALWCSVALYVVLIAFELLAGKRADADAWRTGLKALLGGVSAATVFIANYYDKASLGRVHADHVKMERFFSRALAELDAHGQTEEVLERIAREELIENGNWYSYQLEGTPDIAL